MNFPTILVLVRDQELRQTLETVLKAEGYWVFAVADRREAACALNAFSAVDHILMDVSIGSTENWKLLELLQSSPRLSAIPVTLLSTSKVTRESKHSSLMMPFDLADLLDRLDKGVVTSQIREGVA